MRKSLFAVGLALLAGQPALAAELCEGGPREQWMTSDEIEKIVVEMGYSTDDYMLMIEDGCLEAKLTHEGDRIEIYFEPITGEVMKVKQE
ncbi:PepSY domain-containing protein [Limimaricola soesokkakensis]|uniref:PepSY domain-containing protein n=1 Tax=Limimaricola soesokkakensis TaxID=1343159 RepID=UPI003512A3E1